MTMTDNVELNAQADASLPPDAPAADPAPIDPPQESPADAPESNGTTVDAVHASGMFDELEQEILFWGGEGMDKIRTIVGRLRTHLGL
jgi:hypothetical protein